MTDDEIRAQGWLRADARAISADFDALLNAGWVRQARRQHSLHGTPRVGQVFWVDFPHDAYSPEFVGEHPGVIVRGANTMSDPVILVPLTHRVPTRNPHAHLLRVNPDKSDKRDAYAICDHLYTLALGRLRRFEQRGFVKDVALQPDDLLEVFTKVQRALARVFSAPKPHMPPPAQPRPVGPRTLSVKSKP